MVIALAGNVIALVLGRQQQMLFTKNELRPEKWTPLSKSLDTYWMRRRTRMTLHDARQNPSQPNGRTASLSCRYRNRNRPGWEGTIGHGSSRRSTGTLEAEVFWGRPMVVG